MAGIDNRDTVFRLKPIISSSGAMWMPTVFDRRHIQHWIDCMQFYLHNICGFIKSTRR